MPFPHLELQKSERWLKPVSVVDDAVLPGHRDRYQRSRVSPQEAPEPSHGHQVSPRVQRLPIPTQPGVLQAADGQGGAEPERTFGGEGGGKGRHGKGIPKEEGREIIWEKSSDLE